MVTQDLNAQNVDATPMGERLVAAGLLSDRDLERARLAKREMGCMLGEALVRLGLVAESNVAKYLGEELDIPVAEKKLSTSGAHPRMNPSSADQGIGPLINWRTPTSFTMGVRLAALIPSCSKRSKFSGSNCWANSPGIPISPKEMVSGSQPPIAIPCTSGL